MISIGRWKTRIAADEGASTLEFALTASILFMTILGIMQIGLALYTNHMISEAAREGTRYAIVHGDKCIANGASCTATASQVQSYVQNLGYPGINPSNIAATATYSSYPAGSGCTPNANCANPGNLVTVNVTYAFPLSIPFLSASTLNLSSTSAMVISQ